MWYAKVLVVAGILGAAIIIAFYFIEVYEPHPGVVVDIEIPTTPEPTPDWVICYDDAYGHFRIHGGEGLLTYKLHICDRTFPEVSTP